MDTKSQVIIDEICEYSEKYRVKEMLQEYMKRLVVEKPQDPIAFLIKTIKANPFPGSSEASSSEP